MLVGTPMVWDVSVYIWFCDGCDCSVLLEEFLVIIPGKMVVFSVAVGWLCVHMRRWACCLVLFLLCLICSFENGIAIFEALHQHFPPHGAPGSTHAGDVSVFLFVRNLVIAMIHVQDTPDPEFSFSLQDVPNPWQWLCMHHCGIVDFAEVYNKPRLFLGDWKVGTAPRSLSWFSLSSTQCLITEIDPGCPSLSNHLEGSFFDWDATGFRIISASPRTPLFGGFPEVFRKKNVVENSLMILCLMVSAVSVCMASLDAMKPFT